VTTLDIVRKREQLLARCDAQREYFASVAVELSGPLKIADGAIAGARYLRDHPLVLGAAVAVVAVVRPRGVLKWSRRAFIVWRAYRAYRTSSEPGIKSRS
jgi:hypothetical protein